MCCFSGKVEKVADTKIFARSSSEGQQFLVYSLLFKAGTDLAMILPLPTPKGAKDDAVRFINLEKYPDFFEEMELGFPRPQKSRSGAPIKDVKEEKKLAVVQVGSFIASFVPSQNDFSRLDEQFRIPASTWAQLPQYKSWGFAVFQLKKGEMKVQPMAFEFPRTNPKELFFPTVHIHDGSVPAKAGFDHVLYCQSVANVPAMWEESPQPAGMFMSKLKNAEGLVDADGHVYRHSMRGKLPNKDLII